MALEQHHSSESSGTELTLEVYVFGGFSSPAKAIDSPRGGAREKSHQSLIFVSDATTLPAN